MIADSMQALMALPPELLQQIAGAFPNKAGIPPNQSGAIPNPRAPFAPQGGNGGGVNYPGLLYDGRPAAMRSEMTEYERERRRMPAPASIFGAMVNPSQAGLIDALRRGGAARMKATGYDFR